MEFVPMAPQVLDHPGGEMQFPGENSGEWQAVIDGVPHGTTLRTGQLRREGVGAVMRGGRVKVLKGPQERVEFDGLAPTVLPLCAGFRLGCRGKRAY
jgi:hypothetical protein